MIFGASVVVSCSHTPFNRVWLHETTWAAAQAACFDLSFVLDLLSPCSICSAVSTVWHGQSHLILCFLFSSVVCGVPCRSRREHNGSISLPLMFTLRTQLWDCHEIATCAFSNFSQCGYCYFNNYECIYGMTIEYIHTHIHTYIQTLLAFNMLIWGSLRLAPISSSISLYACGQHLCTQGSKLTLN